MQEITIKPRKVFKHFVVVEDTSVVLEWGFSTRYKNISFGLYKGSLNQPFNPPESIKTTRSVNHITFDPDFKLFDSTNSFSAFSKATNLKDLSELKPITHYESEKEFIQGTLKIEKPGT